MQKKKNLFTKCAFFTMQKLLSQPEFFTCSPLDSILTGYSGVSTHIFIYRKANFTQ